MARTLDAGVSVVLYYGKADTACNYAGGRQVAEKMVWTGGDAFRATPLTVLDISGVEGKKTFDARP